MAISGSDFFIDIGIVSENGSSSWDLNHNTDQEKGTENEITDFQSSGISEEDKGEEKGCKESTDHDKIIGPPGNSFTTSISFEKTVFASNSLDL